MPYYWNYPHVPDFAKLGTAAHRKSVKCIYRRSLKHLKYRARFQYDVWDFHCMKTREHFEKCRNMDDAGEVTTLMKELEAALNTYEDQDMYLPPWDGPRGTAFMRYPPSPAGRFVHQEAVTHYDEGWKEETLDEFGAQAEIEKQRAKFIALFRDSTLACPDYPMWLAMKKRLEGQLKYIMEDIQSTMNKTNADWLWDYPYNEIPEFSNGYKPDWRLDIAMQNHWDEDLWRKVAELEQSETEALHEYNWEDSKNRRSIDRFLPK